MNVRCRRSCVWEVVVSAIHEVRLRCRRCGFETHAELGVSG